MTMRLVLGMMALSLASAAMAAAVPLGENPYQAKAIRWTGTLDGVPVSGVAVRDGRVRIEIGAESPRTVVGCGTNQCWRQEPDGRVRVAPPSEQSQERLLSLVMTPGFDRLVDRLEVVDGDVVGWKLGDELEIVCGDDADGRLCRVDRAGEFRLPGSPGAPVEFRIGNSTTRSMSFGPVEAVQPPNDGRFRRPSRPYRFLSDEDSITLMFAPGYALPAVRARVRRDDPESDRPLVLAVTPSEARSAIRSSRIRSESDPEAELKLDLEGLELPAWRYRLDADLLLDEMEGRFDRRLDGVLGADILLQFSSVIDLGRRLIRLADPETIDIPSDAALYAPMRVRDGIPVITASLGPVRVGAVVDTTRQFGLEVPRQLAAEVGVEVLEPGERTHALLYDDLHLGEHRLDLVVARVAVLSGIPDRSIRLGVDVLRDGYLILEPERGRGRWLRREGSVLEPLRRSGLEIVRQDDALVLAMVVEGSPAADAGFRPGDRLVRIGPNTGDRLRRPSARAALARAAGHSVTVEVEGEDGERREADLVLGELLPRVRFEAPLPIEQLR